MKITIKNYELDIFRIFILTICIIVWFIVGSFLGQISPALPIFYVAITFASLMMLVQNINKKRINMNELDES